MNLPIEPAGEPGAVCPDTAAAAARGASGHDMFADALLGVHTNGTEARAEAVAAIEARLEAVRRELAFARLPQLGALLAQQFLEHPELHGLTVSTSIDEDVDDAGDNVRRIYVDALGMIDPKLDDARASEIGKSVNESFAESGGSFEELLLALDAPAHEFVVLRRHLAALLAEPPVSGTRVMQLLFPRLRLAGVQ